jgi:GNAT superfamily N-acetyltransferase
MQITPARVEHLDLLVESWNRWFPSHYRIDERLLRQLTFDHPSWRKNRAQLAFDGDSLIGFMLAREVNDGLVVIDAVAVDPELRRQKIGSRLIQELKANRCRMGGGPSHFLPGLPEDWTPAADFFTALGFEKDWDAEDLYLTLSPRSTDFRCCTSADRKNVLEMVGSEFSQRWTDDSQARFEAGDETDILIIERDGTPVAFCHAWHFKSALLGPSIFWLRNDCPTFGGIGPVGVMSSERGQGLGAKVVEQALNYLASLGVTEVVVDWTSIGPFYQKLGFESWRRYHGYSRNLGDKS